SGKTTLGLALLAHCKRATEVTAGSVELSGEALLGRSAAEVRALRGRAVAYIPQSPASALNPALRLGTQLSEALHDAIGGDGAESGGDGVDADGRRTFPDADAR